MKQLTSSTKYKFKVRSYLNVDGKTYYSSDSKELNVTTKALAVAAPKNVTSSNVTQDALTLSWDKQQMWKDTKYISITRKQINMICKNSQNNFLYNTKLES